MQVTFVRWCVKREDRLPLSINPKEVTCLETAQPSYVHPVTGKSVPAATRVTLKNKKEFWVVGDVAVVTSRLNTVEMAGAAA